MTLTLSRNIEYVRDKSLLLFALLIPCSPFFSTRILVITAFLTLLFQGRQAFKNFGKSWDCILFSVFLLVGLLYTTNITFGLSVIETSVSLLIIPISFTKSKDQNDSKILQILLAFSAGVILACLICLINAFGVYLKSGDSNSFFFYNLTSVINSHPTYLAYYIIFTITLILYRQYYIPSISRSSLILIVIVVPFLFVVLILTGGSTAFVSMLLVFSFFILKWILDKKTQMSGLVIGVVIVMLFSMLIVRITGNDERDKIFDDSWERFVLWESAIKADTDLVWGVGTGDYKEVLNEYYRANNLLNFANESYNAHNQFIQTLLSNGILGIISLIIMMGRPIYISVKKNTPLGTLVFFPFIIYGVTEVFLGRYQGVVFFGLMHEVFVSYHHILSPFPTLKAK